MKTKNWKKTNGEKASDKVHRWEHEIEDVTIEIYQEERAYWPITINDVQINYGLSFNKARKLAVSKMRDGSFLETARRLEWRNEERDFDEQMEHELGIEREIVKP